MHTLGSPAMLACTDGEWARGTFVQLGSFVVVAHPGDGQSKPPHYVAYEVTETELDALDDAQQLFVLEQEHLTPTLNPHVWYGRLMAALHAALASEPADAAP